MRSGLRDDHGARRQRDLHGAVRLHRRRRRLLLRVRRLQHRASGELRVEAGDEHVLLRRVHQHQHRLARRSAPVDERARPGVVVVEHVEPAVGEGLAARAQVGELLDLLVQRAGGEAIDQLLVPPAEHRCARLREALLGAVVDDGNPRNGEEERQRLLQPLWRAEREEALHVVVVDEGRRQVRVGIERRVHEPRQPVRHVRGRFAAGEDAADLAVERIS